MTALALMSEAMFTDQFGNRRLSKLASLITLTQPLHVDDLDLLSSDQRRQPTSPCPSACTSGPALPLKDRSLV